MTRDWPRSRCNRFASDARPTEEKKKFLDLRRPATKRQLLYRLFQKIDTSGDGKVGAAALRCVALRCVASLVSAAAAAAALLVRRCRSVTVTCEGADSSLVP